MRINISLFLACATATTALAVPFRSSTQEVEFIGKVNKIIRSTLDKQGFFPQLGLDFAPCSDDSNCVGDRECITILGNVFEACDGGSDICSCFPRNLFSVFCTSASDCRQGETCFSAGINVCVADEIAQIMTDTVTDIPFPSIPGLGDIPLIIDDIQATPETTAPDDSTLPATTATGTTTTTSAVPASENPTTPGTTDGDSPTVNPISGDREDEKPSATGGSAVGEAESEDSKGSANQLGLTYDPCQDNDGCAGGRICRTRVDGQPCRDRDDCRCSPLFGPRVCQNDSDCDDGEGCFDAGDLVEDFDNIPLPDELKQDSQIGLCVSRAARDEAVCIASHSLGHISREELVFEKDAVAHVLCDINESCATPGHMVQYRGEGMMMKSYCELTSCVRKVMKVNSPKYRRGLTVPSHTDDLVFTALAARFQSRAEEGVLSAAVRIGF